MQAEIEAIAAYNRGAILCNSLVDRHFRMPGIEADLYFEAPQAECKMCIWGFHLGDVDPGNITATLGEDDGSEDDEGDPRDAEEDVHFRKNLVYRQSFDGLYSKPAPNSSAPVLIAN